MRTARTTVFLVLFIWGVISPQLPSVRADDTKFNAANELSRAFGEVADRIKPSVVSIHSVKRFGGPERGTRGPTPLPPDSPWREFFGDEFFERFFGGNFPNAPYVQQGVGSGVVVSNDGYILTNHHVVGGADEVRVTLSDGRNLDAKVVGTDSKTDLAVVKVDASNLSSASLGNSDQLRVGEWVVASGNPFNLAHTITAGIVSATGRANVGIADYEDFIQTDAAVNPGNSGGPLVNLNGEVVGINTAIFTRTGGYAGIGFAIPINMAKTVMRALIDKGEVVRGWLGVSIQPLTEELAQSFAYDWSQGILVGDVTPGGPADKVGMKAGDIILEMGGQPVSTIHQLRNVVAATAPGTTLRFTVFRDGKRNELDVKVGEQEKEQPTPEGRRDRVTSDLGMTIETLTPEMARQLGEEELRGVVVTSVEPWGVADKAGIRARDIIVSVQGQRISSVPEFRDAMERADLKRGVRLVVRSGGAQRFVFLRTPATP